ncbi:structural protein with Ig domain [Serratia phage BF]|uniref:Ig domain-containing protein n=1 Tax=Serratia phage BF TaxID=1962671 RepID=A0A1S6UA62_9CAUD|nr:structural protein with Ig domain [Serratia phage BF]AQW88630.1 Ig domain-containing protein [Serratia phage BF]
MGKPIAGRNKSPFGVDGINVDAAVLADGTKLTNVRISKQRSINMFDLLSADGATVYPFVKITGVDKTGVDLDPADSNSDIADNLANGTFCISIKDAAGDVVGFAVRLLLNKVVLQDGSAVFLTNYQGQGQDPVAVTGVTVTPDTLALKVGATSQLDASVAPSDATDKSIAWSSDDATKATVSSTGLVTAVANGSATITATTSDGSKTDTCVVTVTTAVTGVTLAPKTVSLSLAGTTTQQLTATIAPSTASNKAVTYVSGTPATATVSSSGLITAVAVGTSTITVTTTDGSKTDTCVVTVTA